MMKPNPLSTSLFVAAVLASSAVHAQERSWKFHDLDYQQMYIDSAKALKKNPNDFRALRARAFAFLGVGRYDKAIAIYTDVMERDPQLRANCLYGRAYAYEHKGEYAKALADFEECLKTGSRWLQARESFAWLLATCPDDKLRNGRKALEVMAQKIMELAKYGDGYPPVMDTLAAAYAETGDFERAISLERALLGLEIEHGGLSDKCRAAAKSRLALYEAHQPYHAKNYSFTEFR